MGTGLGVWLMQMRAPDVSAALYLPFAALVMLGLYIAQRFER
jgi:glutamine synthetase